MNMPKRRYKGIILLVFLALLFVCPAHGSTSSNAIVNKIIQNGSLSNGHYYIETKNSGYEYSILYRDDINKLIFHSNQGNYHLNFDYSLNTDSMDHVDYQYVGNTYPIAIVYATAPVNMATYVFGDTLTFTVNPSLTQGSPDLANLPKYANLATKNAFSAWNSLLKSKTGYSLVDLGFLSYDGPIDTSYNVGEPNNSREKATVVEIGKYYKGEIGSYNKYRSDGVDSDWFAIDMQEGVPYRITMDPFCDEFSSTSLIINLFDLNDKSIGVSYNMEKNGVDYYDYTPSASGTYYVRVYNYLDNKTKTEHFYTFSVTVSCSSLGGHTIVIEPGVEPTCGTDGLTEGSYCSVCGTRFAEQTVIPATGQHSWEMIVDKEASCTETGSGHQECSVCGEKQGAVEIPLADHAWITVVDEESTCTKTGLKHRECETCGLTEDQQVLDKLPHTWTDIIDKEASCTETGIKHKECSVCHTKQEAVEIDLLPHSYEYIVDKPATCTELGLQHQVCSVCGDELETEEIPLTEHTWDTGIVTTKPTTSAAGVKTFTCTSCGETKTEPIAKLTPAPAANPVLGTVTTLDGKAKALSENADPAGSAFSILQVKGKKVKKSSITLSWKAVPKATGYVIYAAPCGSKYSKLTTTKGTSFTQNGLKKGTYYKYFVSAHDKNGNILASSKTVHIATSGGKKGNTKSVKLNKKKVKLKKGKTFKLKATLKNGKLKVSKHRKVAYETANPRVATVSNSGKVKAVGKGTCYVYAYAQNGVFAKCKITVK